MPKFLNPQLVKEHFAIKEGYLYKRLKDGTLRRMSTVREGRVLTVHAGVTYYGPDLAWTLHYGTAPMFPVFTLDGDAHNLSIENVVAARIKRVRFRFKEGRNGFSHPLSKGAYFNTWERCRLDWIAQAARYYAADHANVRKIEDDLQRQTPVERYRRPVRASTAPGRPRVEKPRPPQYVEGFRHYWYAGRWVVVPEACHASDDYVVRCRKTLAGAVRFAFNPETEMTEGFDAAGVLVP